MAGGSLSREQLEEDLFGSWSADEQDDDDDDDDEDYDGGRPLKAKQASGVVDDRSIDRSSRRSEKKRSV